MSVVLFIAVLVVLIVVHELGHFLVAKLFGIKVEEFGIGYPPRAFIFGKWGDTLYTLNWLPFGGFVRIFGESDDGTLGPKDREVAFVERSSFVKIAVLAAGVVFNLVFAWILFSATLLIGAPVSVQEADAEGLDTQLVVSSVVSGSPAASAGLMSGDEILRMEASGDMLDPLYPSAAATFIQEHVGEAITITFRENTTQEEEEITIVPAHGVLDASPGTPAVGIAMALVADQSRSFFPALVEGLKGTWSALKIVTVGLVSFFASAFTGSADWNSVAGPIGIALLVGDASSVGFVYLLYFTAFISVNLAVINLLPLPALDGGRIVLVIVEALRGKPVHEKIVLALNLIGFGAIILLMLIVSYYDILRIFT